MYLSARYGRREEMQQVRERLQIGPFIVNSTWLDRDEAINDDEVPAEIKRQLAIQDLNEIRAADLFMTFNEPSNSPYGRGGRHVEFGYALGLYKHCVLIGYRENIFAYHHQALYYPTLDDFFHFYPPAL